MAKTLTIQLRIPEEASKELRIKAIRKGITLREYCVRVLTDHANNK